LFNIRVLLLFYPPGQALQFIHRLADAKLRSVYVGLIHHACSLPPVATGANGNGREHLKVSQQDTDSGCRFRFLFMGCPACFQKQRRFFKDPLAHHGRRVAPGRI
jgi:hypothetical protein